MFVILTYDVKTKRVSKVMKICRKYLTHVQRSVFEGMITEAKLNRLKLDLFPIIDVNEDQISIYVFSSLKYSSKEQIGLINADSNIIIT